LAIFTNVVDTGAHAKSKNDSICHSRLPSSLKLLWCYAWLELS